MSDSGIDELITQDVVSDAVEPERLVPKPGMQLSARRQEVNWSVEHVANQLNLAPRQIVAIEADDYAALPGIASLRGFIRAYAKLLKMDATPLLHAIANETTPADALIPLRRALPSKPFADNRLELANKRRMKPLSMLLIALACSMVAIFAAQQLGWTSWFPQSFSLDLSKEWQQFSGKPLDPPSVLGSKGSEQASMPLAGRAQQASTGTVTNTMPASAEMANESNSSIPAPKMIEAQPVPGSVHAPVSAPTPTVGTSPATSSMKDLLLLRVHEDSWVEIQRPDNTIVISRLLKAGETRTVPVTHPLSVKIGNVEGVEATLRGTPLDLQAEARGNVASLTLK